MLKTLLTPPRLLSLIPPMTQLNVPYPATAYLTGFLRERGFYATQADLALELVLTLFSPAGLDSLRTALDGLPKKKATRAIRHFLQHFPAYQSTIQPVIRFLQGRDQSWAARISSRGFLPEGPRFAQAFANYGDADGGDPLDWAFGALGVQDRARHYATLYLNDLADVIREGIDPRFEFVRYAESLAQSQSSFDPLAQALAAPKTLLDECLETLLFSTVDREKPDVVLLSTPFPGSVYAAFRIAQALKQRHPEVIIVLGGGWVNTELRDLRDPRVFDYIDYITLDDGEKPLLALLEYLQGQRARVNLVRTFVRVGGEVRYCHNGEPDIPFAEVGTPTWEGLPLGRYLSLLDLLNPMHRLWSDSGWNKLTVAHGCYWKKCSFCDVSLDYISRFEAANAGILVDRIERIMEETGQTGFHFVDEAAPPKALRALAEELARRRVSISWWGNIRFEKSFTPELCLQLADSGCIAISGGLEVASDRLLKLMQKGVSVEQVARVTRAFSDAGVLVHAYLMYGFPTQTLQDTVDALEYVRQLFENGCIQSGFWHRFACTVHSPVGKNPDAYGITLQPEPFLGFARNDVAFIDPTGTDHAALGQGLTKALYNYMHGIGLEEDVRAWFDLRAPRPTIKRHTIARALSIHQSNNSTP